MSSYQNILQIKYEELVRKIQYAWDELAVRSRSLKDSVSRWSLVVLIFVGQDLI